MTWRLLRLIALLAVAAPAHLIASILGRSRLVPPWSLRHAGRAMGLRVLVSGRQRNDHVLLVGNHVSWMDILVIGGVTGSAFVAKAEIASWPLLGWMAAQNQSLFVDRAQRHAAARQSVAVRAALAGGRPLTLFAEGTTSDGRTLLPFLPSLFAAVAPPPPGVVIQPVYIGYGRHSDEVAWTGDEPVGQNARRQLVRRGTTDVTLRFGEPVDPTGLDRKALARACQVAVAALGGLDGQAGAAAA